MKILIITLILVITVSSANAQISDTAAYLNDSIIQKKPMFVGQPLTVLIKKLKLPIYDNHEPVGYVDSFVTKETRLRLYPIEEFIYRSMNQKKTPTIVITFQNEIHIPRQLFLHGEILDEKTGWTKQKAAYWGQFIVADIRIIGI